MKAGGAGSRVPDASTTGTVLVQAASVRIRKAFVSTVVELRKMVIDHLFLLLIARLEFGAQAFAREPLSSCGAAASRSSGASPDIL
jgi:hypothetical protein